MARCPICREIIPVGCNGFVEDTDCFEWSGDGEDGTPWKINPVLSADTDQLLECTNGLFADMPSTLSNPPSTQAYRSSSQAIANNTLTTLTMNVELYDTDTMHSIAANTGRITFTTAGLYVVTLNVAWDKHVTGDRLAQIREDGTTVLARETKDSGGADLIVGHSLTIQDTWTAGQYVEAMVQQTSGASLFVLAEGYSPWFSATRLA